MVEVSAILVTDHILQQRWIREGADPSRRDGEVVLNEAKEVLLTQSTEIIVFEKVLIAFDLPIKQRANIEEQ